MRKMRPLVAAAAAAAALTAAAATAVQTVSADPTGSKNNLSFPADCNGQTAQFVVNNANGQGAGAQNNNTAQFAPAHVVGSNQVFHPTVFDLTFSFTPTGGQTQSFTNTAAMRNPKTPVTCSIDFSTASPGGTFGFSGTVQGFFS